MFPSLQQAVDELDKQLELLRSAGRCPSDQLVQRTVALKPGYFSVVSWLAGQQDAVKLYWSPRNRARQIAALGVTRELVIDPDRPLAEQVAACEGWLVDAHPSTSLLGGVAFDGHQPQWAEFGPGRFVLPRIELIAEPDSWELRCNLWPGAHAPLVSEIASTRQLLAGLTVNPLLLPRRQPALLGIDFNPSRRQWYEMVNAALASERQETLAKVVLSRQGTLQYAASFDPWPLLQGWRKAAPNSYSFAFQFSPRRCFMGCSPEKLFDRHLDGLRTEALAGTTARSTDLQRDAARAQALLEDSKNVLENTLVIQDIEQRLAPLCRSFGPAGERSVLKLRRIQHLRLRLQGQLHDGVSTGRIIEALHPTPAVGGMPREPAKRFIRTHEPYSRGWYAGACGRISPLGAEFTVAIRSALIEDNQVHVFSGAGIVPGSDPGQEWQELGNKLSNLFTLLVT